MRTRLLSFLIWALVLGSAGFWASRFLARPTPVPAHAAVVGALPVPVTPLTRLFGVAAPEVAAPVAAPVAADARFKLIGVAAARAGQRSGLALIAVGDKPARTVSVGGQVEDGLVVLSISHRQVELGPRGGAATATLTLPAMQEASRGVPGGGAPVIVPPAPSMPHAPVAPPMPQTLGGRPFNAGQLPMNVPQAPVMQQPPGLPQQQPGSAPSESSMTLPQR